MKSSDRHRSPFPTTAAALLGLAALTAFAPAFADKATKQKTTGSHIARDTQSASDDVRLEEVEVMLGAVRDARSIAREARDDASDAPNLPTLGGNAFLDDVAGAQPPR
jgi:hypothetical protein